MRRGGDGSDRRHAGLVHVAVILLLLLHLDALMIRSRKDGSWAGHKQTDRERISECDESFLHLEKLLCCGFKQQNL